jgi:RNA polymerase sigma-70 factor (ECF subfamily)
VTLSPNAVVGDLRFEDLEQHRRARTGHSYRMLGSGFEADDAVPETLVRGWRNIDSFEGRAALKSWLFRIATNVCLDMLRGRERRARPMDLGPATAPDPALLVNVLPEYAYVTPVPDARIDPAEAAESRESIRLAFVAALQHLPAKQRAVLILREVLRWQASEVAELLDTTVASVNSALQRARATLAERAIDEGDVGDADAEQQELLARYVDAFERYDMDALVDLLHEDAIQSMPPYAMWLDGRDDILAWWAGPGIGCKGSRLLATTANGCAAFGQYRVDPEGGHTPWALQVLEISGGRIVEFHAFLDTSIFALFGLPDHLD